MKGADAPITRNVSHAQSEVKQITVLPLLFRSVVSRLRGGGSRGSSVREAWSYPVQCWIQFSGLHPYCKNPQGPRFTCEGLFRYIWSICQTVPAARQEAQAGDQSQEKEPESPLERDLPVWRLTHRLNMNLQYWLHFIHVQQCEKPGLSPFYFTPRVSLWESGPENFVPAGPRLWPLQ